MVGVVDENVTLVWREYSTSMTRFRITHSLEVPMNYVIRVEVTEALSDVR